MSFFVIFRASFVFAVGMGNHLGISRVCYQEGNHLLCILSVGYQKGEILPFFLAIWKGIIFCASCLLIIRKKNHLQCILLSCLAKSRQSKGSSIAREISSVSGVDRMLPQKYMIRITEHHDIGYFFSLKCFLYVSNVLCRTGTLLGISFLFHDFASNLLWGQIADIMYMISWMEREWCLAQSFKIASYLSREIRLAQCRWSCCWNQKNVLQIAFVSRSCLVIQQRKKANMVCGTLQLRRAWCLG